MNQVTTNMHILASSGQSWTLGKVSYTQLTSNTQPFGREQQVDTTPTLIDFGDALPNGAIPNIVMIVNLDPDNTVTVDNDPGMGNFPQWLPPNHAVVLMPQIIPLYAQANLSLSSIWTVVG